MAHIYENILSFLSNEFFPATILVCLAAFVLIIWALSGASSLLGKYRLLAWTQGLSVGLNPTFIDTMSEAVKNTIFPNRLLNPKHTFVEGDLSWFRSLHKECTQAMRPGESVGAFCDRRDRELRETVEVAVAAVGPCETRAQRKALSRSRFYISKAENEFKQLSTAEEIHTAFRSKWKRILCVIWGVVGGKPGPKIWFPVVFELLDYVGRGSALGLLVGVIVRFDDDILLRVSVGTSMGAAIATIAWQRAIFARFAIYIAKMNPLSVVNISWLEWLSRHPVIGVLLFYVFAVIILLFAHFSSLVVRAL